MSPALIERAELLAKARAFFANRKVLEVDVCALSCFAPSDLNIDSVEAQVSDTEEGYLHTSPEYAMKRLLSTGSGDIYYLGHVFRKGEIGRIHNPEFTMAEWYRLHFKLSQIIQETCEFLFLFFGPLPIRHLSYREAFSTYLGIDYTAISLQELQNLCRPYLPDHTNTWQRSNYVQLLLTQRIEPHLGTSELTILTDFPPSEAALAKTTLKNHEIVAERFEIYHQGIELANGYHESSDPVELRQRFLFDNQLRHALGKKTYPIDETFLHSLPSLPPCCGVSVGFDRAFMLYSKANKLSDILFFTWQNL